MSKPSRIVLEKWLAKKEREFQKLTTDATRQWAAVPRKPDSFAGAALTQDASALFPNVNADGDCNDGVNDWPMRCAPNRWSVFLHNPVFDPVPPLRYEDWSSTYQLDYFNREWILERVPDGSLPLILGIFDLSDSTNVALWQAPAPEGYHESETVSFVITGTELQAPPDIGNAYIRAALIIEIPYGLIGSVVRTSFNTHEGEVDPNVLHSLPCFSPVKKQDYDGPAVDRWFYFNSRRPIPLRGVTRRPLFFDPTLVNFAGTQQSLSMTVLIRPLLT